MCPPLMFMEAFTAALRVFSFDSINKVRLTDMNHEHVELAAEFIDRHFPVDLMPGSKLEKWKRAPQLGRRITAAPTIKFFWRNDCPGKALHVPPVTTSYLSAAGLLHAWVISGRVVRI